MPNFHGALGKICCCMKRTVPISCAMHIFHFVVDMYMLLHQTSTGDVIHPLSLLLCQSLFHPVGYPLTDPRIHSPEFSRPRTYRRQITCSTLSHPLFCPIHPPTHRFASLLTHFITSLTFQICTYWTQTQHRSQRHKRHSFTQLTCCHFHQFHWQLSFACSW